MRSRRTLRTRRRHQLIQKFSHDSQPTELGIEILSENLIPQPRPIAPPLPQYHALHWDEPGSAPPHSSAAAWPDRQAMLPPSPPAKLHPVSTPLPPQRLPLVQAPPHLPVDDRPPPAGRAQKSRASPPPQFPPPCSRPPGRSPNPRAQMPPAYPR